MTTPRDATAEGAGAVTKVPKAKIIKAHKLADELLAIWQTDIRPYCDEVHWSLTEREQDVRLSPRSIDNEVQDVAMIFRNLRREVMPTTPAPPSPKE